MSTPAKQQIRPMTSDEFLVWALDQADRYELVDGYPVKMQAERVRHTGVKGRVFRALGAAIERAGLPCEAWTDGAAVQIDETRTRQPDAVVTCGVEQHDDALALEGAVIVVEVLSPTNQNIDKVEKLADYGSVSGLAHYLIVHPIQRYVIHYRLGSEPVETRIHRSGDLVLDPPGLVIDVDELFLRRLAGA